MVLASLFRKASTAVLSGVSSDQPIPNAYGPRLFRCIRLRMKMAELTLTPHPLRLEVGRISLLCDKFRRL